MKSTFLSDLEKEQILTNYLDIVYHTLGYHFQRITDLSRQLKGMDLVISLNNQDYIMDEKAQLHYLNKDLPTFTFEISYLKNRTHKIGWLLDSQKETDYYFLITGIMLHSSNLHTIKDLASCKITSVNRQKLISYLSQINLTTERLQEYDFDIRNREIFGKTSIKEIPRNKGCIYFSNQLNEQPINLQFRLAHLIEIGVAKQIYPTR
tara:strand:+ start:9608 stop:10228 length:621 start_codon:yes stop_codon:yes gene_type:complete